MSDEASVDWDGDSDSDSSSRKGDAERVEDSGDRGVDGSEEDDAEAAANARSTYRGVLWHSGRWRASISVDGRRKCLGRFDDEEAAARAYDEKAKQVYDNPVLNFLPDGSLNPDRKPKRSPHVQAPKGPSTYRGVVLSKGRWIVTIFVNRRRQYFGPYDTEEEAARAFDEKAKQLHDNPVLNFLPDGSLNPDRTPKPKSKRPVLLKEKAPKRRSSYKGVTWGKGRWKAEITVNGRQQYLRTCDTKEEAARVYDEKAKQLHGNPVLNFLPDGSLNPDRRKHTRTTPAAARSPGGTAVPMTPQAKAGRYLQEEETGGQASGGSGGGRRSSSSSSSSLLRRGQEAKEGVNGEQMEDGSGRRPPWKRGRWDHEGGEDEATVGIKKGEE